MIARADVEKIIGAAGRAEPARGFPTARQFAEADLVVMYLHLPPLTAEDFTDLRAGITDDRGMVGTTDAMRDPEIKAQEKAAARGEKPEDLRERETMP